MSGPQFLSSFYSAISDAYPCLYASPSKHLQLSLKHNRKEKYSASKYDYCWTKHKKEGKSQKTDTLWLRLKVILINTKGVKSLLDVSCLSVVLCWENSSNTTHLWHEKLTYADSCPYFKQSSSLRAFHQSKYRLLNTFNFWIPTYSIKSVLCVCAQFGK